ncbi:hypothetical protein CAL29_28030 [Bordetella genomosp. 10]|uniref:Uncharacterized protein n=1 Tax=Bordetella genomosp. 10 TaxID=1416804 RepID=A0A261S3I2_9BORD|nr:hypothetical protein [Bordetella genomosp. 10]OZI31725.1 hypothetical protein CAL29_28030 [Bordetella genomosp. 10]
MPEKIRRWCECRQDRLTAIAAQIKLWTLFFFLVGVGSGFGALWMRQLMQPEIDRLQSANTDLIAVINNRLPPLVGKVDQAAGQLDQASEKLDQAASAATRASRTASQAAATANGAAVNAARANIRPGPASAPPAPARPSHKKGDVPEWLNTP